MRPFSEMANLEAIGRISFSLTYKSNLIKTQPTRRLEAILLHCWSSLSAQFSCLRSNMELEIRQKICKEGGYRYDNGCVYVGSWNSNGKQHGQGHLLLADGTRYDGVFENGLYNGLGVLTFPDGAKYEGEFFDGWFHGCGIFWRADGMKHEGEFRGGKIWGLGLTTFSDGSNGFPRSEGFYKQCKLIRKTKCPEIIQRAQRIAFMARTQFDKASASF